MDYIDLLDILATQEQLATVSRRGLLRIIRRAELRIIPEGARKDIRMHAGSEGFMVVESGVFEDIAAQRRLERGDVAGLSDLFIGRSIKPGLAYGKVFGYSSARYWWFAPDNMRKLLIDVMQAR